MDNIYSGSVELDEALSIFGYANAPEGDGSVGNIVELDLRKCQVTTLGTTVKLSRWDREARRFIEVDILDDTSMEEAPRSGKLTFKGTSRRLRNEVGLSPAESLASFTLSPRGCTTCG